ncbi:hypothetical protein BC829DRAFT_414271 [Chytridium lagenaria]|nr:hypothetical protein BC829DRAFT_414271 [Chytridium lagenaria]
MTNAKSKIKSSTRREIGLRESYFVDGSLHVGQGQAKSSLYYAFSETGRVLVAKVYERHEEDYTREVETNLKPSNIMLQNTEHGHATLVDYGATVPMGSDIIEVTREYCLDADKNKASEHLDWICLGTTLAQMGGFQIVHFQRVVDLASEVSGSSQDEYLKNLIVLCLQSPTLSRIKSAL